jgi:Curli production assembly/transport component CsgG
MKSLIVGFILAVMSSAALADVSVGQFADKRATLSDDNGSKAGNPNYIGTLRGGYGWKTGEASEDKPVADVVRDHVVTALTSHGINVGNSSTVVSGTIATLDASAYKNREAEVTLQVVVARDGNQLYANTFNKKIEEKTGFFTTNGAAWSTSKHRDEVRLCAEHALDQTLNDMVADAAFLAAIK